jgi:phage FluMu protein Com
LHNNDNKRKAGDPIDVRAVLRCKDCETDLLHVGLTADGALAMLCPECDVVVMYFEKWPDEAIMPGKHGCSNCGCCGSAKDLN